VAGWITAFKIIPWADVIAAAPAVARGAKNLWDSVGDKVHEAGAGPAPGSPEGRLRALESQLVELRRELATSSELINSLAEQNGRLVDAVGILRVRTRALLVATIIAFALLAGIGVWIVLA